LTRFPNQVMHPFGRSQYW